MKNCNNCICKKCTFYNVCGYCKFCVEIVFKCDNYKDGELEMLDEYCVECDGYGSAGCAECIRREEEGDC